MPPTLPTKAKASQDPEKPATSNHLLALEDCWACESDATGAVGSKSNVLACKESENKSLTVLAMTQHSEMSHPSITANWIRIWSLD